MRLWIVWLFLWVDLIDSCRSFFFLGKLIKNCISKKMYLTKGNVPLTTQGS